ncbi:nucleoside triphosphate pyrophosphohydrolase [Rhizorhabdus wittichii DC-6]|uniref:Nucleoside triphosphate pyrophosphohydrolase n=1 Tax=Rhizorhabdus wittichii TaxID=160791 RepID=A0A975HER2_9SPHN|nr:nucleoside triphosphate pyrophosphohydrolase [Rhizorhabdus wittichii]ARR57357.1 nucleoside triphosphate pyrophosphohydrolase [Rhizorhabdus wittichii DC-6]QTH22573.1 nucleoside triphosphate pyrophosphohydrolase [Rhizorhabdus wittichii]
MLEELRDIMARLRDPETGCPWDVEQDFRTIAPYTIEEAYEVADAIERDDMAALRDELGDLQLQVVFHARMAEEAGAFDLKDVLDSISAKMIRRHPHVFGDGASPGWEEIKAAERAGASEDRSALAGVASALPALLRAEKLQKRAARTGFDWPDPDGARDKVAEEIDEVRTAATDADRFEEMGDLLFAVVNWSRKLGIDPEAALRAANLKFEKRFRAMEDIAGEAFKGLSLDDKEALWVRVKRS